MQLSELKAEEGELGRQGAGAAHLKRRHGIGSIGRLFGRFGPDVAVFDALEERLRVEFAVVRRDAE